MWLSASRCSEIDSSTQSPDPREFRFTFSRWHISCSILLILVASTYSSLLYIKWETFAFVWNTIHIVTRFRSPLLNCASQFWNASEAFSQRFTVLTLRFSCSTQDSTNKPKLKTMGSKQSKPDNNQRPYDPSNPPFTGLPRIAKIQSPPPVPTTWKCKVCGSEQTTYGKLGVCKYCGAKKWS